MQDFLREVDPDIIIGYNICKFDLPYLIEVIEIFSFLIVNAEFHSKFLLFGYISPTFVLLCSGFFLNHFFVSFVTILYGAGVTVYVTISALQLISHHVFLAYRGLRPWELLNSQY